MRLIGCDGRRLSDNEYDFEHCHTLSTPEREDALTAHRAALFEASAKTDKFRVFTTEASERQQVYCSLGVGLHLCPEAAA